MSETTTHTPQNSDTCELVLDYVYGELDEARKRTFEEHLPGCARCQQEVASFGRVRTATKRMMAPVEPTAPLTGALHTQLMHAAAQRKPRRGVLLAFPRKIMQHPALSAAAMFALVGGAIAINWSRGKMAMPATAEQSVDTPKQTEVAAASPPKVPAAEPMPGVKHKEQAGEDDKPAELALDNKNANEGVAYKDGPGVTGGKAGDQVDKTRIALETPSGTMTVQRPTAHRAVATPAPKKEAPPAKMRSVATDGKAKGAKYDSSVSDDTLSSLGKDEAGRAGLSNGVVGGGGRGVAENAKSSAPQDLERKKVAEVAEKAPARDAAKQAQHGYATSSGAPAAASPAPPPVTSSTSPSSEREESGYYRAQNQAAAPQTVVQKPAQTRNYESLRKNAVEWAKTGRCDEAIKGYQELENAQQYIPPNERVHWIHCLAQIGRQDEAQRRLDDLKVEKRVTNAQIQDVEKELNDSRRRVETKAKAAKKAPAAADRAPSEVQQQQRRSNDQPAQAAPPDSTNTKVKTSPAY
jgi:hypothetical protein